MSPESAATYAVIIVNYGDPSLIAANIGADVDADDGALVVVVDNFHSVHARAEARELCRERGWVFVASANDGFGAGVNRGVEAALLRGHVAFITLNPDAIASADVLRALAREVSADPTVLVSPYMDSSDGRPHFRGVRVSEHTGQMRSGWSDGDADPEWKNWLSGACLAFHAEAFDRLDGFREDFFMYWEDVDISRRAVELGMTLDLRSDLLVVHDEGGTQETGSSRSKSPLYYYFNIRNRLLFGLRNRHGRDRWRWILATPRQSALIWMRGGRRQAFSQRRGLVQAVRGMLAGLATALPGRGPTSSAPRRRAAERSVPAAPTSDAAPLRITIAIPTFRRPEMLRALLEALPERIAETPDAAVDVLVVDNDAEGSAREVAAASPVELRYVVESTPGIAAVRNRALEETPGSDVLAFIDDDEVPLPQWLSSLVEVWRLQRPCAVMGRVVSVFDEDADPWVLATGTFFRPDRPTGTRLPVAATGNLLLDVQQVRESGVRFDESLGLGGGEDVLFSRQLVDRGAEIIFCSESVTEDYVVASRVTREWVISRAFSSANGSVHVDLRCTSGTASRLALRARYLVGGAARVVLGQARHQYGRSRSQLVHDARGMRAASRGKGMIAGALGHHFQAYSRG